MKGKSQKRIAALLAILVIVGLLTLLFKTPPAEWSKARQLGEFIESAGFTGGLVFFVVAACATSIGLPRQFFAFAAGFAYGVPLGVFLSSVAAICGCALTFYGSKRWLSTRVQARFPNMVSGLNGLLVDDTFMKILVLRLQPLGTNLITNLCAGVTDIPLKLFLVSSWIGYLPQMLVFALLGTGVRLGSTTYFFYSASMLLLSVGLGWWLYKRYNTNSR